MPPGALSVPVDDTHTMLVILDARNQWTGKLLDGAADLTVMPPDTWRDAQGEYHMGTFPCQDGMAWETQGKIFDRSREICTSITLVCGSK